MKKIFIDVTRVLQWQGRLTGIPRVEYELASRFIKYEECTFVMWYGYDFCEVDKSEILKINNGLINLVEDQESDLKNQFFIKFFKSLLGRSIYLKKIYRRLKSINILSHKKENPEVNRVISVRKNDKFFIGQGVWSDKNYINKVVDFHKNGAKIIQVAYDMLPIVAPQYSGHSTEWLHDYASNIYPICSIILSISKNTKNDIQSWLASNSLKIPKIEVFRLGEDFKSSMSVKPEQLTSMRVKEKFILCVGTIEARKNHTLLYYVYKLAVERGIELPKLVIVGRRGWRTENIFDLIKSDPDTCDNFFILESASDEELTWLYKNCLFTIYPSFYEGWGLPIAESMYYGVPCACSNTSSMTEIAGDLAHYFSPTSTEGCLKEICKLLEIDNLNNSKKNIKKYHSTSWDETFIQIRGIIGDKDD